MQKKYAEFLDSNIFITKSAGFAKMKQILYLFIET